MPSFCFMERLRHLHSLEIPDIQEDEPSSCPPSSDMKEDDPEHINGDHASSSSSSSTARDSEILTGTKDPSSSASREKCRDAESKVQASCTRFLSYFANLVSHCGHACRSRDAVPMKEGTAEYPNNGPSSSSTARDLKLHQETKGPSSTCEEECRHVEFKEQACLSWDFRLMLDFDFGFRSSFMKGDNPEYHNNDTASTPTAQDQELPSETQEQRCRSHDAVAKRRPLKMKAGSCYIPQKTKLIGDDAHFVCEHEQVVGVADGVGGWAKLGVDAGEYARELTSHAEKAVRASPEGCVDPHQVLATAHARTNALGSSTACIVALKDQFNFAIGLRVFGHKLLFLGSQYIHTVNIGDSGFLVVRNNEVFYHSPTQQLRFNRPYQLQKSGGETLNDAEIKSIGVEPGDIIVVGTDGVFDNLFDREVIRVIKSGLALSVSAERMANLIADEALRNSIRRTKETPFSIACRKAGKRRKGGKKDDITVVVMCILEADD
ncbi:probable protein phosphatase 2C 55 [Musa acuminata AAA Group]|uniref:probable protein phosphatase 2C 55 n=1 Tax=Musa acuminata AAA Group TaxID=214697 RepID=UPI0031E30328